ncbi:NUDIX hydrolase [Anaerocolumna sp. MB42-C2]|uniref:NUDIX hydrolase n=1 Tax=Anaerocolumna sp. MB42-C2 TaxID=3070997 RepID=UPI0027DEC47E|nr:NUDIX hydrolase [Anaerocolumna sp. MB42-C2]WMJ90549.1 NUDIX hydrolase [Anaerocolumna sp. MB42-C2]
MIHVNARAIIVCETNEIIKILIQKRTKKGEECYELPGGHIEEFESITDALRREVLEETGLNITYIENEKESVNNNRDNVTFKTQCITPFSAYQTIAGPVDSFGIHFICSAKGLPLKKGDDTQDIHWATIDEVGTLISKNKFSNVDIGPMLMFIRDKVKH